MTEPVALRRASVAVLLVSAALICFQISFTRLVSYKLYYHFVFLSISLCLLGLAIAGTYVAVRPRPRDLDRSILGWLMALAISIPIVFLLIANPFPVQSHTEMRVKLYGFDVIAYLLWCSPMMVWLNFCGGVVLTYLFSEFSNWMGRLYGRDLIGAGLGCLACVGVMKYGSPPVAFVAPALLVLAAQIPYGRALADDDRRRRTAWTAALASLGLGVGIFLGPPGLRNFENFRNVGEKLEVRKYEWNHLIRTDHIDFAYVLDGDAATPTVEWSEQEQLQPVVEPSYVIGKRHPRVAIIGFGGGPQVAEARRAQASHILAIDINPTIARWVLEDDRQENQGLFDDPSIEVVVADGRHALRNHPGEFDVIVMHAIDTYAATAAGAYALSENFLYTEEAFQEFFNALSDDGILTVSRWLFNPPRENLRLFATALEALQEVGVEEPARHLVMMAPMPDYETLGAARIWGFLMMSKRPFSEEKLARLEDHLRWLGWSILYAPGRQSSTPFDTYLHSTDRGAFARSYPYLVSAVTDASPYLFQFYRPFHRSSYRKEGVVAVSAIYQSSSVVLPVALALSVIVSFVAIIDPLRRQKKRAKQGSPEARTDIGGRQTLYFACLGLGFMALEVPLTQVLALYLGHPVYGFAVVLVCLLIFSGMGSQLSTTIGVRRSAVCALIAAQLAVLSVSVFPLVRSTIHLSDPWRFLLAVALAGVYAVPMGFPLAIGIRELGRSDSSSVAWAWAINGASSVIGSCLVIVVMVFVNTYVALGFAALCYAVAAVAGAGWGTAGGQAVPSPSR